MPNTTRYPRREFLRRAAIAAGALAAGGMGWKTWHNHVGRAHDPARSDAVLARVPVATPAGGLPNIVLIVADDLGYGDLGCYGGGPVSTPHLDALADRGTRLTGFNACSSLCSPSRAGLLTGRYPIRTHITMPLYPTGSPQDLFLQAGGTRRYGVKGIPDDELLLPELLQARGYRTALTGKWHLGDRSPSLPNENGFDLFFGAYYSNSTRPYAIYRNREVAIPAPADQDVLTQRLTVEACNFIRDHHDAPFFLYHALPFPHAPLHASDAFRGTSDAGLYGDVVAEIDWSAGEILATLEETGVADRSIVIFTSDNGPWWEGSPGGIRGRKNLVFEGGHRVPCIVRWPGVVPAGQVVEALSVNFDLFPTLLAAAGVDLPGDRIIDGRDMRPLLTGATDTLHDTFYYYKSSRLLGVRRGPWKYLRRHWSDNGGYPTVNHGPFLFNLETDPNESYSMIQSEPAIAAECLALMEAWGAEIDRNVRGWLDPAA